MMNLYDAISKHSNEFVHKYEFQLAGIPFRLLSNEFDIIIETGHYLPTQPEVLMSGTEQCIEFRYIIDQELQKWIRELCFSKNGQTIFAKTEASYRQIDFEDNIRLYASDLGDDPYAIVVRDNCFTIVSGENNESAIRSPLRMIREVVLRYLENKGGCFTHAAAVTLKSSNQGLLIIGDKGDGKTTSMWQLLLSGQANFINNDRVILLNDQSQIHMYPWPLSINLGMGTLQSSMDIEHLKAKSFRRRQDKGLWEQQVTDLNGAKLNWGNRNKLGITPLEVSELTGVTIQGHSLVNTVLFPKLVIGSGELRIEQANHMLANQVLKDNLREPIDEEYLSGWLDLRKVDDKFLIKRKQQLHQLLLKLPMYTIYGDPRKFRADELFQSLVKRCG